MPNSIYALCHGPGCAKRAYTQCEQPNESITWRYTHGMSYITDKNALGLVEAGYMSGKLRNERESPRYSRLYNEIVSSLLFILSNQITRDSGYNVRFGPLESRYRNTHIPLYIHIYVVV